jgi:PAS domain S-box-containing protein
MLQDGNVLSTQITANAPAFLYLNDLAEDCNVFANQTMLTALGYSELEWLTKEKGVWRRLVHPQDLATYASQVQRMSQAKDGETNSCEYRLRHKNGTYLRLAFRESVFLRFESGSVRQIVGTAEEVGETALMLHALEEEKTNLDSQIKELQLVWNQKLFGLALAVGAKPSEVKLNPILAEWLQLSESTDLATLARAFGFTQNSSSFGRALNRAISSHGVERLIHREDGSVLRLSETVHPLPDSEGQIAGFVAYFMPGPPTTEAGSNQSAVKDRAELELAQKQKNDLQAKLDLAESHRRELEGQLALSEEVAARLQELLDRQSEVEVSDAPSSDEALIRAKAAETRLEELDTRWRETLALLLSSNEEREKLVAQNQALQAELREHTEQSAPQLQELADELKATQAVVASLTAELAENRGLVDERAQALEAKLAEIERLKVQVAEASTELDRLKSAEATANALEGELAASQAVVAQLEVRAKEAERGALNDADVRAALEAKLQELSSKNGDLAQQLSDQRSQTERLAAAEIRLREQLAEESQRAAELIGRRSDLEGSLAKSIANISQLESAKGELEARTDSLHQAQASLQSELDQLRAEAAETVRRERATAEAISAIEDEKLGLARQLELAEATVASLNQKVAESDAKIVSEIESRERLAAEFQLNTSEQEDELKKLQVLSDSIQRELRDAIVQAKSAHDASTEESALSLQALKAQLLVSQTKLHEGEERWWKTYREAEERERERLAATKVSESLSADLAKVTSESERLRSEVIELERRRNSEIAELRDQVEAAANLSSSQDEVRQKLAATEAELASKTDEAQKLANLLKEAGEALESSQEELRLLPELNQRLSASEAQLASQAAEYGELAGVLQETKDALADAQAEARLLPELREKLSDAESRLADLALEFQQAVDQLKEANDALASSQTGLEMLPELRQKLSSAEAELASQTEKAEILTNQITQANASLASAQTERDLLQTDYRIKEEQLVQATQQLSRAEASLAKLEPQLKASEDALGLARSEADKAQSDLNSANLQLRDTTSQLADLTRQLDTLQVEFNAVVSRASVSEAALSASEVLVLQLKTEVATADQMAENLSADLKEKIEQLERTQAALGEETRQHQALKSEAAILTSRVDRSEEALSIASGKLTELQAQFNELSETSKTLTLTLKLKTEEQQKTQTELTTLRQAFERSEVDRREALDKLVEVSAQLGKIQEEFRKADEKYRALAASMPCVVLVANSLGLVEYVNDQWLQLTGVPIAQAQEGSWKQVVHGDDYTAFLKAWTGGMRSGEAFSVNFRVRRKDGMFRWHTLDARAETEGGRIQKWVATLTEIHEQISAREAARQARLRYGALLDNTGESILFLSPSGHVLGASKASLNLLRRGAEGVVGTPLWETPWWLKSEETKLHEAVNRAATGDRMEIESIRIDHERQHRPARVVVVPVKDENEQVAMLVAQFRDVA